jgi:Glycosyl hydrolases family 43
MRRRVPVTKRTVRLLVMLTTMFAAVGILAVTASNDAGSHQRERTQLASLAGAERTLATLQSEMRDATQAHLSATGRRQGLESAIHALLGRLATTDAALDDSDDSAFLQGAHIAILESCLDGLKEAYQQVAIGENDQAGRDVAAVSGPCISLSGGSDDGLVYPFDFPDPDVLEIGGTYFAYATNSVAGNIQIIESSDLAHWSALGDALPTLPRWAAPDGTWAPGVVEVGSKVLLYYAARVAAYKGDLECISVASADVPQGPFVDDSKAPLECQRSLGGSIDPSPFVGAQGHLYLSWKSGGGGGTAKIWSQELDAQGTGFASKTHPVELLAPEQTWEGGNVEAPDMVVAGGRYYLFFSGGEDWNGSDYAIGVVSCKGPLGPCADASTNPLLSSGPGIAGPGGESVFTSTSGSYWIAFDAYIPGAVGYPNSRDLFVRPLDLSGPEPVVGSAGQ